LVFLDTSALVKLFVEERGSARVVDLAAVDGGNTVVLSAITSVELYAAIHRRERAGDVPAGTAGAALETLRRYLRTHYLTQALSPAVLDRACALVERHALRAYDALQLAGAIEAASGRALNDVLFATADQTLLAAAAAEGLRTFNPSEASSTL